MNERIRDGNELTGPLNGHSLVAMPRPPRLQFEGALYHAYTRGNRRERTFLDDADYKEFEDDLLDFAYREKISLYAWCLMPNHFHLLLETPQANLSVFMQRLLTRYAHYFNRCHKFVGHVFQGRYEAILCDRESYFLELVRYIHLNPYRVKNKRWKVPETGWPWSSHRYYLHGEEPMVVRPFIHNVLGRFGDEIASARQRYERFVADGLKEGQWEDFYQIRHRKYLGSDQFVEEMRKRAGEPLDAEKPGCRTLDELIRGVCLWSGVPEADLRSNSKARTASRARQAFVFWAREWKLATTTDLARCLNRDPSAISHMLRQTECNNVRPDIRSFRDSLKTKEEVTCG